MFLSFVRPERISSPMTRIAAVTDAAGSDVMVFGSRPGFAEAGSGAQVKIRRNSPLVDVDHIVKRGFGLAGDLAETRPLRPELGRMMRARKAFGAFPLDVVHDMAPIIRA